MKCPRTGHSTALIDLAQNRKGVLVVGGGDGACPELTPFPSSGEVHDERTELNERGLALGSYLENEELDKINFRTAANTVELFEPESRRFKVVGGT